MASEWPVVPLGDVINLKRGYDLAAGQREDGSVPIISSSGPTGKHSKAMVDPPGVVTGRYGTIGLVHYVEEPYWPLNTTLYVQDFKENEPRFVYYLLKTIRYRDYLDKAAVPGINRNDIHRALVSLPPISEQKAIAKTIESLDVRIGLIQKQSETLEAIARAIFKSWFVDFDPVRAKAEGREPEGMDAATAALFPNEFQESATGLFPTGWASFTLGNISTVGIGKTPPRAQSQWFSESDTDVVWVSIRDMGKSGSYIRTSSEFLTREAVERFNVRLVPDNTVILSFKLTVGRVAISDGTLTTNEAIAHCVLGQDAPVSTEFLYCALSAFDFSSLSSTSSIAEAVNSKSIRELKITVPTKQEMDGFTVLVKPIFERIKHSQRTMANLTDLRDTLLPRLISGKLRVPEAEKLVEAII